MGRLATVLLLMLTGPLGASPRQFEFPAAAGRLVTGLYLHRGDEVRIVAQGAWTMWSGHFAPVNAAGHRYRTDNINWGRLTARVGSSPEIGVGTERTWSVMEPGELVLYPYLGELGLKEPAGTLQITIEGGTPTAQVIDELAAEGTRLTLRAGDPPLTSDLWVSPGESVQIDAFGFWTMWPEGEPLTAAGDLTHKLANGMPWGRLLARVGGPTFAPEPDYEIGVSRAIRPERGGLLQFRPALGDYAGYPRTGELTIVVRGAHPADSRERALAARLATDYERAIGFLRIHQARKALGLPDAVCDPALMRAAQAHAEYLAAHDSGHDEAADQPGFTGATPTDRAVAAGFAGTVAGELIHGYTAGLEAVDGLWATIYHRVPLLDAAATACGIGVAQGERSAFVVLVGVPRTPAPADGQRVPPFVTYPLDNQVRVPTSWSGQEKPSPFAPDVPRPVGYPLSFTLTGADLGEVVSASLDTLRNVPVPIWVIAPGHDPAGLLRATAFLVPQEPLLPETGYRATITVRSTTGEEFTHTWTFTTGLGQRPFLTVPQLGHPANPPLDFGRGRGGPGSVGG